MFNPMEINHMLTSKGTFCNVCSMISCKNASCVKSHMRKDKYVFLFSTAVALVCKYITKGWKGVQEAYGDKEISDDLQKVFGYLEAVEKAKHSTDEQELIHFIEEQRLEKEQVLTNHLKSKEV